MPYNYSRSYLLNDKLSSEIKFFPCDWIICIFLLVKSEWNREVGICNLALEMNGTW